MSCLFDSHKLICCVTMGTLLPEGGSSQPAISFYLSVPTNNLLELSTKRNQKSPRHPAQPSWAEVFCCKAQKKKWASGIFNNGPQTGHPKWGICHSLTECVSPFFLNTPRICPPPFPAGPPDPPLPWALKKFPECKLNLEIRRQRPRDHLKLGISRFSNKTSFQWGNWKA